MVIWYCWVWGDVCVVLYDIYWDQKTADDFG